MSNDPTRSTEAQRAHLTAKPLGRLSRLVSSLMGPVALAIGYLETRDLTIANWWMVAGALLGLAVGYARTHRMQWVPLILALEGLIVGALSLALQDSDVIAMRATFIEGALGAIVCIALQAGSNPLEALLGRRFSLSSAAWRTLGWRFALLCFLVAVANEFIRRTQSNQVWILFHFPGLPVLHALFVLVQWPWLSRAHAAMSRNEDVEPAGSR